MLAKTEAISEAGCRSLFTAIIYAALGEPASRRSRCTPDFGWLPRAEDLHSQALDPTEVCLAARADQDAET